MPYEVSFILEIIHIKKSSVYEDSKILTDETILVFPSYLVSAISFFTKYSEIYRPLPLIWI